MLVLKRKLIGIVWFLDKNLVTISRFFITPQQLITQQYFSTVVVVRKWHSVVIDYLSTLLSQVIAILCIHRFGTILPRNTLQSIVYCFLLMKLNRVFWHHS